VELAVLTARIDRRREIVQQRRVELAPHEGGREHPRVHAREPRAQAGIDHVGGQSRRLHPPEREKRLQSGARQPILAIAPHVVEEEVAERHVREAFADAAADDVHHGGFVFRVRTGVGQRHGPERQTGRRGLRLEHVPPNSVHRHAVHRAVHRRQERRDRPRVLPVQHVERPGAVLAAAPRQEDLHYSVRAGPHPRALLRSLRSRAPFCLRAKRFGGPP
jgi:hypothetical protein